MLLGTLGIIATLDPIVSPLFPPKFGHDEIQIKIKPNFILKEGLEFSFTRFEAALGVPAAGFCAWYWQTKHWAANNVLGLAFSLQGIEHLSLGAVQHGVILLCGLFFYDVFWVFFTPVMVTVAKSFDAPIKLLFPKNLLAAGMLYSLLIFHSKKKKTLFAKFLYTHCELFAKPFFLQHQYLSRCKARVFNAGVGRHRYSWHLRCYYIAV